MNFNDYQALAQRTANTETPRTKLINGAMGLCGESGEVIDHIKKHLWQTHELDGFHILEELGDILWYIAETATGLGVDLDMVATHNIDKLMKRYPNGFEGVRSREREV